MNKLVSWSEEDEAVAATNSDATECKRGAVELGYWSDPYVRLFSRPRAERRAPEIHRGYYARVRAVEMFIHQFLERCDSKCQVLNLGCGFDTLFWRLRDVTQAVGNFIELDFPTVTAKKCQIIKRNKQLLEKITNEDGEVAIRAGGADLHADGYHLCGVDLRDEPGVLRALTAASARPDAPTLVLAECVLVYLREDAANRLLRLLAQQFPKQVLVVYEQCNLDDKFGEVMIRNLVSRGCGEVGARHMDAPGAAAARLLAAGYDTARGWDMDTVWRSLSEEERARVEALEPLDERELLQQLHAHYALTVASRGDLFADIDLNA
ncbi:leucine carboxyl methyltransferase 1 [Cydia pomonella]|uniref:leucine carboxyl methyltransferase 1 n=1 Tax=Cydia pomonella TaxID=82600 RepID=UPI002ADE2241|nr:leucine carboxyl methyltransferase 1 [Cydia pomonella]